MPMPRDAIHPVDAHQIHGPQNPVSPVDHDLPQRMYVGPANSEQAIQSMLDFLQDRRLNGFAIEVEITAIGSTGHHAKDDEEALLDSVAELLISTFRGGDLIARTGEQTFMVIAAPLPDGRGEQLTNRLSKSVSRLLAVWRSHGLVTCCAMTQHEIAFDHEGGRHHFTEAPALPGMASGNILHAKPQIPARNTLSVLPTSYECNGRPT